MSDPAIGEARAAEPAADVSVTEWDHLVSDIFACEDCTATYRETGKPKCAPHFIPLTSHSDTDAERHQKFPTIGASKNVRFLIVGMCPRYSADPGNIRYYNVPLFDFATSSLSNFRTLATNKDHRGLPYIRQKPARKDSTDRLWEPFYEDHARIAVEVYGQPFEDVAVATEMYLCALPPRTSCNLRNSPCAAKFLVRAIKVLRPEFIITCHPDIPMFFRRFVAELFENGFPKSDGYSGACVIHLPKLKHDGYTQSFVNWTIGVMKLLKGNIGSIDESQIRKPDPVDGSPQEIWIYEASGTPRQIAL
jgi:hypothetical protein